MGVLSRVCVAVVFGWNVICALQFIIAPAPSALGYGLYPDFATQALVSGLGVAFLMWNATYPLVIVSPKRFHSLHGVVIAQQLIGLVGELFIRFRLVEQGMSGTDIILGIDRFVLFDGVGLLLVAASFALVAWKMRD